nr:hypothetical protein [uncultured Pseudomonas sp.]
MQVNQADDNIAFTVQATAPTFSSVWGNEMQREDFLALAAGVRQFSATQVDLAFVSGNMSYSTEHGQLAAE